MDAGLLMRCSASAIASVMAISLPAAARGLFDPEPITWTLLEEPVDLRLAGAGPTLIGIDETHTVYLQRTDDYGVIDCRFPDGTGLTLFAHTSLPLRRIDHQFTGFDYARRTAIHVVVALDGTVEIQKGRCDDAPSPENLGLIVRPKVVIPPERNPAAAERISIRYSLETLGADRVVSSPDGRVCLPYSSGVYCVDPDAAVPSLERVLASADLEVALFPAPWWFEDREHVDPDTAAPLALRWEFGALTFVPDGRLVALAVETELQLKWIVLVELDGSIRKLIGPIAWNLAGGFWEQFNPLSGATQLVYDASLDAVLAWPVFHNEFGAWLVTTTDVLNEIHQSAHGFDGIGFRVLPLSPPPVPANDARYPPSAYLDLTKTLFERIICYSMTTTGCPPLDRQRLIALPDGGLAVVLHHHYERDITTGTPPIDISQIDFFRIELDTDALDLDRDSVDAATERELGISDYQRDSDGGGDDDGAEVFMTGTDPADPDDDPTHAWALEHPDISYSTSQLIRRRMPKDLGWADGEDFSRLSVSGKGPLCVKQSGRCYDRSGAVVASFDPARLYNLNNNLTPVTSADGTFVALLEEDALVGLDFATGERFTIIAASELSNQERRQGAGLIPVSRELTFSIAYGDLGSPVRVDVIEEGARRMVYDHLAELCASRVGACLPPLPGGELRLLPRHDVERSFQVIGYLPETGQLLIYVFANWDWSILAVSADRPPVMVRRLFGVNGLNRHDLWEHLALAPMVKELGTGRFAPPISVPTTLLGSTHGLMTDEGPYTPWFAPAPVNPVGWINGAVRPGDFTRATWDGIVIDRITDNATPGWLEWVAEPRRVEPGDILWLAYERGLYGATGGYMLYKSGPRGGSTPLWTDLNSNLVSVTGMDIGTDGILCIADRGAGELLLLAPEDELRIPRQLIASGRGDDIVDCAFDGAGRLHVLSADPGAEQIYVLEERRLAEVESIPLPEGQVALQLLKKPDGSVAPLLERVAGATYTRAGELVRVKVEGARASVSIEGTRSPGQIPFLPDESARYQVKVVERPDGWLALMAYDPDAPARTDLDVPPVVRLWAMDRNPGPAEETQLMLATATHPVAWGTAIALVPGGRPLDPWTGDAIDPYALADDDRMATLTDFEPYTIDTPAGQPRSPASTDRGCGGGAGGGALFALLALARRGTSRRGSGRRSSA